MPGDKPPRLEPYPDAFVERIAGVAPGPQARYDTRESVALAFIAGLQRLPPRARAVLVLRDVLGFPDDEVADMLETDVASVGSALLSARATLERVAPCGEPAPPPGSPRERALVGRFAAAFAAGDIDGVVALLTPDARLTLPSEPPEPPGPPEPPEPLEYRGAVPEPEPVEYRGAEAIREFLTSRPWWGDPGLRLIPTGANAQPAFACYLADAHTPIAWAHGLLVLTLAGDRIAAVTRFRPSSLHPCFGLPRALRHP